MDISALTHQAGQYSVTCQMAGDTGQMEDQRQWGDATFKTYIQPLAKPWPYIIDKNAPLDPSVKVTV